MWIRRVRDQEGRSWERWNGEKRQSGGDTRLGESEVGEKPRALRGRQGQRAEDSFRSARGLSRIVAYQNPVVSRGQEPYRA